MSDLQTALIAIGACVVAGVYGFNLWQERQFRRRVELAFERKHDDALIPEEKSAAAGEVADERIEPRLDHAFEPAVSPVRPLTAPAEALKIDAVIDFTVETSLPAAAASNVLQNELAQLAAGWDKPVLAAGYDRVAGRWQAVTRNSTAHYAQWRFAVQMSNRAGCIDRDKLEAFLASVQRWADSHGATEVRALDVEVAHTMAQQLDRFCADVDIAIGMNVVTSEGNAFAGTKIRALAEAGGMKLEGDGVFYLRNDAGRKIYTLDNHEPMPFVPEQMKTLASTGVTFLLDVPCVAEGVGAFENMLATARNFASTLDGSLVDDNRKPLTDEAIDKIRRQLTGILAKMEAGQIAAGGARALRLFS